MVDPSFLQDVPVSILPRSDNTYDLGSSSYRWRNLYAANIYTSDINLKHGWKLFEREDGIYLEKDGKVYKVVLEEVHDAEAD